MRWKYFGLVIFMFCRINNEAFSLFILWRADGSKTIQSESLYLRTFLARFRQGITGLLWTKCFTYLMNHFYLNLLSGGTFNSYSARASYRKILQSVSPQYPAQLYSVARLYSLCCSPQHLLKYPWQVTDPNS